MRCQAVKRHAGGDRQPQAGRTGMTMAASVTTAVVSVKREGPGTIQHDGAAAARSPVRRCWRERLFRDRSALAIEPAHRLDIAILKAPHLLVIAKAHHLAGCAGMIEA